MSEETPDAGAVVQAAALEAIKAVRSFLDVAEGVVRDPSQAAVVGRVIADAAGSMFRPPASARTSDERADGDQHHDDPAEDEHPRVRRIHLSD